MVYAETPSESATDAYFWSYDEETKTLTISGEGDLSKQNVGLSVYDDCYYFTRVQKGIPTINHDRDIPLKCLHMRTNSSCQAVPSSQNQIRKCEQDVQFCGLFSQTPVSCFSETQLLYNSEDVFHFGKEFLDREEFFTLSVFEDSYKKELAYRYSLDQSKNFIKISAKTW